MKLNIKTLCSIGALLLCSESVLATKNPWYKSVTKNPWYKDDIVHKSYQHGEMKVDYYIDKYYNASVIVKGPIRENDQLKSDPSVTVRKVIFEDNNLKKFPPEIENWLKNQREVHTFTVWDCLFEEFPAEIFEWFPYLESITFHDSLRAADPVLLLSYGNLKHINIRGEAYSPDRVNANINRQKMINRYKGELQIVENLISEEKEELSDLQKQLESLNKIELDLKKAKASKRQRKFVKRDIKKGEKALTQQKETLTNLLEKKESFETVIGKLEKAQKESLEIAEREESYLRNLWNL